MPGSVRREAADIMNIKLMKCGGLYRGSQISAIGESFGVTCMVGCMMETKIAITAGLSLVAAKKNITEADCDSFLYYKGRRYGNAGRLRDTSGYVPSPGKTGTGT